MYLLNKYKRNSIIFFDDICLPLFKFGIGYKILPIYITFHTGWVLALQRLKKQALKRFS